MNHGACSADRMPLTGRRRRAMRAVLGFLLLAAPMQLAQALQIGGLQGSTPGEQQKELLVKRVQEFYSLVQSRQVPLAEQYVTKETRHRLKDQVGSPFLSFKLLSANVETDGLRASVTAELTVLAPFSTAPVPVQRNSAWKVEEGEWRIDIPETPAGGLESWVGQTGQEQPKPEELKFEGHRYGLGVMKPGERKEAKFPFENVTDHVVKITNVATGCECLKLKTTKLEYRPGEKGEVVIEFDSTNFEFAYDQTAVVTTSPGEIKSYLRILAHVVPRAIAFPEKEAEKAGSGLP